MADDFAEKLNAVLGNPDAMGQIMSIAQALSGDSGDATTQTVPASEAEESGSDYAPVEGPVPVAAQAGPQIDMGNLLNLLGGLGSGSGSASDSGNPLSMLSNLDPRLLQIGMRLLGEYSNNTNDRKTALLTALKPFLKEERFAKVDKAIQIARISRIIRVALQVWKEGGEKTDV